MAHLQSPLDREPETNAECVEEAENAFGEVHILTVGKPGVGKSTLVRCMGFKDACGDAPSGRPCHGKPGEPDISKVWDHPTLPLHIHDSNGIDIQSEDRVAVITKFLDAQKLRQVYSVQRVHIWCVMHVADSRILDNGQLTKLIGSYGQDCHLQLIATHADLDSTGKLYRKNIEANLDVFLDGVARKEELKKNIIKVCNVNSGKKGEEFDEEEIVAQQAALRELSRKTMDGLQEKQKLTWVAAEAVDVSAKLHATAKAITSGKFRSSIQYSFGYLMRQKETMEEQLLKSRRELISQIWKVPPKFMDLLWGSEGVRSICKSFVAIVLPGNDSWFSSNAQELSATLFKRLLVSFTMISAACVLFVRRELPGTWKSQTEEQYIDMCARFPIHEFKGRLHKLGIWYYLEQGYLQDGSEDATLSNQKEIGELLANFLFYRDEGSSYLDLYNPKAGGAYNNAYHSEERALESPEVRELAEHHRIPPAKLATFLGGALTISAALVQAGAAVVGLPVEHWTIASARVTTAVASATDAMVPWPRLRPWVKGIGIGIGIICLVWGCRHFYINARESISPRQGRRAELR